MYLAYFKKVRAANMQPYQKVDEVKSRKALDFKSVEENILVLQEHISTFVPSRLKSALMVLACLGC
jgi:ABC-type transport system involved in cytochrome bd biosynthesis fused ATPase/permease subunit